MNKYMMMRFALIAVVSPLAVGTYVHADDIFVKPKIQLQIIEDHFAKPVEQVRREKILADIAKLEEQKDSNERIFKLLTLLNKESGKPIDPEFKKIYLSMKAQHEKLGQMYQRDLAAVTPQTRGVSQSTSKFYAFTNWVSRTAGTIYRKARSFFSRSAK